MTWVDLLNALLVAGIVMPLLLVLLGLLAATRAIAIQIAALTLLALSVAGLARRQAMVSAPARGSGDHARPVHRSSRLGHPPPAALPRQRRRAPARRRRATRPRPRCPERHQVIRVLRVRRQLPRPRRGIRHHACTGQRSVPLTQMQRTEILMTTPIYTLTCTGERP